MFYKKNLFPKITLPFIFCFALMFVQCEDTPGIPEDSPLYMLLYQTQVTEANNEFAFNLFEHINQNDADSSVFISPFSVGLALSMTQNGAVGGTLDAMKETLELDELTLEQINWGYKGLLNRLPNMDENVQLNIGNGIWYDPLRVNVLPGFLDANTQYYDSEVAPSDFQDPASVDLINDWIENATEGNITDMLQSIPNDAIMYIVNAIHFNGAWRNAFNPDNTITDNFQRGDGSMQTCQMMRMDAGFPYFSTPDYQAVDLAYADSLFSMTVVLPQFGVDVNELANNLSSGDWATWRNQFVYQNVFLRMPRFSMEYENELKDELTNMGMGIAFNDPAAAGSPDFSNLGTAGGLIYISKVKHKAFVDVNEEGTEASAATLVEIVAESSLAPPFMQMNRPFLFFIRETQTNTILFMGKVMSVPES